MAQNFTYTQCGDYYIPDIKLSYTSTQALGKYGRMRRAFLEQNKPMLFNDMILTESLFPHLREVQQTCEKRMELLMTDLLGKNPAPDKATQQLASCSIAVQQMVAIARAVDMDCQVLILDEPTSSLDEQEVEKLFKLMRELRAKGVGIIFVTHFLDQVYEVCDKITVCLLYTSDAADD